MAREHKKAVFQGEAITNAISKGHQAPSTDTTRVKRKPSVDVGESQHHSVKRSKVNSRRPDGPTDDLRQTTPGQKAMATPHGDAEQILLQTAEHLSVNERQRDQSDVQEISQTTSKPSRLNGNAGLRHVPQSRTAEVENLNLTVVSTGPDSSQMAEYQLLPLELRHLADQYDCSTMSIISSAKIESRVRNLLERVQKFRIADTKAKPGIVILRAKANVASKLCSVVELAKQQIETDKGRWWQYNKLHGELLELNPRRTECTGGGKTLSKRSKVPARDGITIRQREKSPAKGQDGEATDEEADDMDEEPFEVMTDPKLRERGAIRSESGNGKKIRTTPIMTIFLAMVPVPGLKELYG